MKNTKEIQLQKARELCSEIEKLPASEQQTKVSIIASNLSSSIQYGEEYFWPEAMTEQDKPIR